jgi:hypothetical protein
MAQAKTYEHETIQSFLNDMTAQSLLRPKKINKNPVKPVIFTKKDHARLEKLEIAMDNVEDNIEDLIQNLHVQYSIFDATANALKLEIQRLNWGQSSNNLKLT